MFGYKEKVKDKIYNYVKTNYTKISNDDFVLGAMPYNFRCHLNSVQAIHEKKADKVFLVIAIERDNYKNIIVHFINQQKNGKYIDNTWGWTHKHWNYYIIREIEESEFNNITVILTSTQTMLVENHSNSFLRWINRVDVNNFV